MNNGDVMTNSVCLVVRLIARWANLAEWFVWYSLDGDTELKFFDPRVKNTSRKKSVHLKKLVL